MSYVESLNFFGVQAKEIPCIRDSGAPTAATEAAVGCFYMNTDTGNVYKCIGAAGGVFTWEELVDRSNPPVTQLPSAPVGIVVENFQPSGDQAFNGWSAIGTGSTLVADTQDFLIGTQSARFTNMMQKSGTNISIAGKRFRVRFKVNEISSGARLLMYLSSDTSFSTYVTFSLFDSTIDDLRRSVKLGEWTEMSLPWCACNNISKLDSITNVDTIRFKFHVDGGTATGDANVQMITVEDMGEPKGILSFTFDDGSASVLTDAAKILGARGITGTAYIIPSAVGQHGGYMTEEQVISLKTDYGWDIESHANTEVADLTESEMAADFASTKKWIQDRGLGRGDHYAYAGGTHNALIEKVVKRYFASARTIDSTVSIFETNPGFICNPYRLSARSGVTAENVAAIKSWIDEAVKYGGWLILVFHHIGTTNTSMYCTAEALAEIADYAISSGIEIKTVADALR